MQGDVECYGCIQHDARFMVKWLLLPCRGAQKLTQQRRSGRSKPRVVYGEPRLGTKLRQVTQHGLKNEFVQSACFQAGLLSMHVECVSTGIWHLLSYQHLLLKGYDLEDQFVVMIIVPCHGCRGMLLHLALQSLFLVVQCEGGVPSPSARDSQHPLGT